MDNDCAVAGFRGFAKKNLDEIDGSSFSGFNGKRSLDEIENTGKWTWSG